MSISKSLKVIIIAITVLSSRGASETTDINQYGITWHLEGFYITGQYVNGDYWVLDNGGGVKVLKTTPNQQSGDNGSMINPIGEQAYDDEAAAYNPDLLVEFPRVLNAGESLVTTISGTEENEISGYYKPSWNSFKYTANNHVHLKTAAVLTIVDSEPNEDQFRPAYIGTDKRTYSLTQVNLEWLTDLPAPASITETRVKELERSMQRPWLIHPHDFKARDIHPYENMLNYHRDIGSTLGEASCVLATNARTKELLINFIQVGIDYYHMTVVKDKTDPTVLADGRGDSAFWKWPIIYTGLLLQEPEIYQLFCRENYRSIPRTAEKFYYIKNGTSDFVSSIVPPNQTWTGSRVGFRKQTGNGEHEHAHPSEWNSPSVNNSNGIKQERYRHCCDSAPSIGFVISAILVSRTATRPILSPGGAGAAHADSPIKLWFPAGNTYSKEDTEEYPPFDYAFRWMNERFVIENLATIENFHGELNPKTGQLNSNILEDLWWQYCQPLWEGTQYTMLKGARIPKQTPATPRNLERKE